MRIELTHSCLQGRRSPIVPEKHLVREDGHYPAVTFKDTCALNPFQVPWLEHGCLFLHTLSWCLIRGSNPGKTDFESAMSAICINQTYRSDETVAILLFGYLFSCTEMYLLPFAYHLCWHSHEDSNSDTRFRRPLHCPVVLCECIWCASPDSNRE